MNFKALKRYAAFMLALVLCLSSVNTAVFAEDANDNAKQTVQVKVNIDTTIISDDMDSLIQEMIDKNIVSAEESLYFESIETEIEEGKTALDILNQIAAQNNMYINLSDTNEIISVGSINNENMLIFGEGESSSHNTKLDYSAGKWVVYLDKVLVEDDLANVGIADGSVIDIIYTAPYEKKAEIANVDVKQTELLNLNPLSVETSLQQGNWFSIPRFAMSIAPGTAAKYGYANSASVSETDITALDVLVALHVAVLSESGEMDEDELAFLHEMLEVTNGWVKTIMGEDGGTFSFVINGETPTDGIWNENYWSYTSYMINEAVVNNGDVVDFYFIQDTTYWSDLYTWFEKNNVRINELTVYEDTDVELSLKGLNYIYYGSFREEDKLRLTEAVEGATIALVDTATGELTPIDNITTDEDGLFTISFDEPGTYVLSAIGDEYTTIVSPWFVVTVEEAIKPVLTQEETLEAIYNTFNGHGSTNPMPFPYGNGEGEFENAISYIKHIVKEIEPAYDVDFTYAGMLAGTVGSSDILKQTTMDSFGNITPVYNETASKPAFTSVIFKLNGAETPKINLLYFSVEPINVTKQEMVDKEASAIVFDAIKGKNTGAHYITSPLGKISGSTVGALNTTAELYKTDVQIAWKLEHVSGNENALTLNSSNKTTVVRPNVSEGDGVFKLIATVSHKSDSNAKATVAFDLTVPEFVGYKVPFRITPEDATLEITDSYYKIDVDDKYVYTSENGALRTVILHHGVTDAAQSYSYSVSREGYITTKGNLSVKNDDLSEINIELVPSSIEDNDLKSLEITNPVKGSPSIIEAAEDFSPNISEYTMKTGNIQSITISPTIKTEGASIVVRAATSATNSALKDYTVSSGATRICYLSEGENIITITVKAPESSTQDIKEKVYTLKVIKDTAATYPLKTLAITASSSVGAGKNNHSVPAEEVLSPTLDAGGIAGEYTYFVNCLRDEATFKPTANASDDVEYIKVNGEIVASGSASQKIALDYGNNTIIVEAKMKDNDEAYSYNINVRRKQPVLISSYSSGNYIGTAAPWSGSVNFGDGSDTAPLTMNLSYEDAYFSVRGVEGKFKSGETAQIPVKEIEENSVFYVTVSRDFTQDDVIYTDSHVYVIGLYRVQSKTTASAVESFLPAPGQFVNQSAYYNPDKTLSTPYVVTLGSFGGNIVYRFDEPVKNDPTNPYGIDFIVYGNVFTNADGSSSQSAAEPAAVMVSENGTQWYELAGSKYYDVLTKHGVSITYTNPDTTFSQAYDVAWTLSTGESGVIAKNSTHRQAYYPNPDIYAPYNLADAKTYNPTYNANSVSFEGTLLNSQRHAPAFGYADTHSTNNFSNEAANPYVKNHFADANGDGMDISWAVDGDGNPVELSQVQYVKVYNPNLVSDGSSGEISPEISYIQRAKNSGSSVGTTEDAEEIYFYLDSGSLAADEKETKLDIQAGIHEYSIDAKKAAKVKVKVNAQAGANILVNDQWVATGEYSAYFAPGNKVRIIVQEGIKEPVSYIINLENLNFDSNAEIGLIDVLPGYINSKITNDTYYYLLDASIEVAKIKVAPMNTDARVYVNDVEVSADSNWLYGDSININKGETKELSVKIVSKNGESERNYIIKLERSVESSSGSVDTINVFFKLIGDSNHEENQHTAFETWVEKESFSIPVGSSAKYLTDMVLMNRGIEYKTDAFGTYIESIKGLAQFDNGPNSGWLYRINGAQATIGYDTLILNEGDYIEWKYSDNWEKEDDNAFSSGNNNENIKGAVSAEVTGLVNGEGIAEATLSGANYQQFYDNIANYPNEQELAAVLSINSTGEISGFSLNVRSDVFQILNDKLTPSLMIVSKAGMMALDEAAIEALNNAIRETKLINNSNDSLNIEFKLEKIVDDNILNSLDIKVYNGHLYKVSILIDGNELADFNGGIVKLYLPVELENGLNYDDLSIYCIKADGDIKSMANVTYGLLNDEGKEGFAIVEIDSLSMFAVASETYTANIEDEQTPLGLAVIFEDVDSDHWAYKAIMAASAENIVSGTGNNRFEPNRAVTRAEFVTMLSNLNGIEESVGELSFSDVPSESWFYSQTMWAYNNGIIFGIQEDKFAPDAFISRQDALLMVERFIKFKGAILDERENIVFIDYQEISDYAKEAIEKMANAGIITGYEDGSFCPKLSITRAEAVTIIMKIREML